MMIIGMNQIRIIHTLLLQEQLRREEEEYKKRQNKKRQGVLGYFFSGFVGVIVGALLVWLFTPFYGRPIAK